MTDGLLVFKNTSGSQSEKIKNTFQKIFNNKGLDIIINCNMKIVNYPDIALNLTMDHTVLTKNLMKKRLICM